VVLNCESGNHAKVGSWIRYDTSETEGGLRAGRVATIEAVEGLGNSAIALQLASRAAALDPLNLQSP
jgi:hypothetical protein